MFWLEQAVSRLRDSDGVFVETLPGRSSAGAQLTYRQVFDAVTVLQRELLGRGGERPLTVGLVADNSPEWVVADLACLLAGVVQVPVPLAFSADQARSLLAGTDLCLVDGVGAARLQEWADGGGWGRRPEAVAVRFAPLAAAGAGLALVPAPDQPVVKVIHTSGTTSAPKGVRTRAAGLDALLAALHRHLPAGQWARYLSVVPLSLLIEQVTAVYLTLMDGGTLVLPAPEVPLLGTAPDALRQVLPQLAAARPTAMQGPPALYKALALVAANAPDAPPQELSYALFGRTDPPFLACGGAPVAPEILQALADRGIGVYEGYGLSENGSVASINTPDAHRIGTVGQPLDHVEVRIAADGELLLRSSSLFAGYTTDDPSSCHVDADGWLHTGDLAALDGDGFLTIRGRKKNIAITADGRNVAPDWVAARYQALPEVLAAVVFADGLDAPWGLFVLADGVPAGAGRTAVERFGAQALSQVEQVRRIHTLTAGDPRLAGLFTLTGRPVRERVWQLLLDLEEKGSSMSHTVQPYGTGAGRLVEATPGATLAELDAKAIVKLLGQAGFLVLRGFGPGPEDFNAFVARLSSRIISDPAREFVGNAAQKVDAGLDAVGLHLENGNSPFRPDLTWFLCAKKASTGSQTTVCDGYRVYDELTPAAQQAFSAQDIVYSRTVPERLWKGLVSHMTGGAKRPEEVTLDDARALAPEPDRTEVVHNADGSIHYAFRTPAVRTSLVTGDDRKAWANSIFGPSFNYEKPQITFADGSEIDARILDEAQIVTDRVTENVEWENGDVVVIDNSRVMHGRRAIEDPVRTIYNAQSYLNAALLG